MTFEQYGEDTDDQTLAASKSFILKVHCSRAYRGANRAMAAYIGT